MKRYFLFLIITICANHIVIGQNLQLEKHWWQANSTVRTVVKDGNTIYLGGDFTYIGPNEPYGTVVNNTTGTPDLAYANPNGQVLASVPDGNGGWYIGGNFTKVGGVARNYLARLNADGSLHAWNPGANNMVRALALNAGVVYAAGNFTLVNGQERSMIAAINGSTGMVTSWQPPGFLNSWISSIQIAGANIYIGGYFTYAGNSEPYGAAVDPASGIPDFSYANPNSTVNAAIPDGNGGWYIGGDFTEVGGLPRSRIAQIDAGGQVTSFATNSLTQLNSTVNALALNGSTLYAGGDFTYAGPLKPYGVSVDATTGVPDFTYLSPDGVVRCSAPDGNGGWYIGGEFTQVGGQTRNYIARINADGSLNNWNPNADSHVLSLLVSGSTVYAGGYFDYIGGVVHSGIAAIDATTGIASSWNPNMIGSVHTMAISGTTLYVGGYILNIGGLARSHLAAISTTTGIATSWNPAANNSVMSIALSGTTIFVGGSFTTIAGQSRYNLAAISTATGAALAWNPNPNFGTNSSVNAVVVNGTTVYVGGGFQTIGGQTRPGLAALSATTGLATTWNPNMYGYIHCLKINGGLIYAGGDIRAVGGQERNNVVALDLVTGLATTWNPDPNYAVYTIATNANNVYLGGQFFYIGGFVRKYLLAMNATTGAPTNWNPDPDGKIYSLAVNGTNIMAGGEFNYFYPGTSSYYKAKIAAINASTGIPAAWAADADGTVRALQLNGGVLYAGGFFSTIAGQPRNSIAALNATTGAVTAWNPNGNGQVYSLALNGATVYAGGYFSNIGGQNRNNIAALDAVSGLATTWNPNANQGVQAIAIAGSAIHAGGSFTNIGGQTRNYIAALDAATGLATNWNPNADYEVKTICYDGTKLYAGGNFRSIGGQTRNRLAALDLASGNLTSWNPDASNGVLALAESAGIMYAGGIFTNMGGLGRNYIAAIDATTGATTSWNPSASAQVNALTEAGGNVYVGGNFTFIGGQARNYIAAVDKTTGLATSWNPISNSSVNTILYDGTQVYAGGGFTNIGGQARNRVAAIDVVTGNATTWNPNANSTVNTIALAANKIYVGGNYTSIGGETRNNIAALDATTGTLTSWNPNSNGRVYSLASNGTTVYAGGQFSTIGGQSRNNIAALDPGTGNATTWNPNANSRVNTVLAVGSVVYAGGIFTSIGGQTRNYIAALDAGTGLATTWNPNANSTVQTITASGPLYVGGSFTSIGGQTRNRIAAISSSTGLATTWNPNADGTVYTISVNGTNIYTGGSFNNIGGQTRRNIAAISSSTGLATAWNPDANSTVNSIRPFGSKVYVGGFFAAFGSIVRRGLAELDATTGLPSSWDPGFEPGAAVNDLVPSAGMIFSGGTFTTVNGEMQTRFAAFADFGIQTGAITGSPFCAGNQLTVPFTKTGTYYINNTFTAQLSDASGSFSSPVNIGSVSSSNAVSVIATIPLNTAFGTGYKVRVVADGPGITGSDNGTGFTINPSSLASINTNATLPVSTGQSVNFVDGFCKIINKLESTGGNPVTGSVLSYVFIDGSPQFFVDRFYVQRHYEIAPAVDPANATGRVTLYFTQQEFDNFNAVSNSGALPTGPLDGAGISNIRITKFAGTSSDGSGNPGTYGAGTLLIPDFNDITWNSTGNRWEISFNTTGFSGFFVHTGNYVLPLTLLEFTGRMANNSALLNWKTSNEINAHSFDIERSADGINFTAIGNRAAFNTPGSHQYNFTDNTVKTLGSPVVYYRLKQKDNNGGYGYSAILVLPVGEHKSMVLLYPNPVVNDQLNLSISVNRPEKLEASIIDHTGRILDRQVIIIAAGSTTRSININKLAKGAYYLKISGQTISESKPFVKQ